MNKAAFTAGFLSGLAEDGMTPFDAEKGMEKISQIGALLGALSKIPYSLAILGGLGIAGTRWGGRAVGQTAEAILEPNESDIDIAKKEEELEEYRRLTQEARQRALAQAAAQSV